MTLDKGRAWRVRENRNGTLFLFTKFPAGQRAEASTFLPRVVSFKSRYYSTFRGEGAGESALWSVWRAETRARSSFFPYSLSFLIFSLHPSIACVSLADRMPRLPHPPAPPSPGPGGGATPDGASIARLPGGCGRDRGQTGLGSTTRGPSPRLLSPALRQKLDSSEGTDVFFVLFSK